MPRRLALAAALLAAVASGAEAQPREGGPGYESFLDVPARPSPPRLVNDLAGALSAGEAEALERKLVAYADSAGPQVAVVTVRTTDGADPGDYAGEVLRAWGVGRAGVDDGVVLLVAVEDREVFIATGYGAEPALTDATAGTIVRSVIVPAFRRGQFYAGIDAATDAITASLSGEFEPPARRASPGGEGGGIPSVLCCLLVVFIVLVVLSSRAKPPPPSKGGRKGAKRRRRSGPGVIVLPGFGGGWGGSSGGFGGGGFGGGFGGGGFGGFGGGFGGGGGAGGSW